MVPVPCKDYHTATLFGLPAKRIVWFDNQGLILKDDQASLESSLKEEQKLKKKAILCKEDSLQAECICRARFRKLQSAISILHDNHLALDLKMIPADLQDTQYIR
jgi:hypothetical protein